MIARLKPSPPPRPMSPLTRRAVFSWLPPAAAPRVPLLAAWKSWLLAAWMAWVAGCYLTKMLLAILA